MIAWASGLAACTVAAACLAAAPAVGGQPVHGQPVPGTAAAKDPQKGVAAWTFGGVDQALARSGASWYYTWAPAHPGITARAGRASCP